MPETPMKAEKNSKPPLAPITDDQSFRELNHSLREASMHLREIPNFLRILAHSPAALKACVLFDQALAQGRLTPQQREQIALTIAEINGCSYSLSLHCHLARHFGLSGEDIRLARRATAADPQAKAMLRFAQTMVLQRGEISPDDFQPLRQTGFTDAQIIEIIIAIGQNIFANYFNTAVRTPVDFPRVTPGMDAPALVDSRRPDGTPDRPQPANGAASSEIPSTN